MDSRKHIGSLLVALTLAHGCAPRPEGWTAATHGERASAGYEEVFAPHRVLRLDVTIAAADWQAQMDDMTSMAGEFGQGPGGPGGPNRTGQALVGAPTGGEAGDVMRFPAPAGPEMSQGPPNGDEALNDDAEFLPRQPLFVPCRIDFEGRSWHHVGIRFKGNSTLLSSWAQGVLKLPFRLDFDELEGRFPEIRDQRFFGFQQLSLTSNGSDASFLREKLVADLLEEAGIPAGRATFARLYVDRGEGPLYFGLYTIVEVPDRPLLMRAFGSDTGNLYKPQGGGARFTKFDRASFEKHTNRGAADWSDVEAAIQALNAPGRGTARWRDDLESVFDADGFLRWLAFNTAIENWDAYGGLPHNYYIYGSPLDRDRLHWIPWDHDLALGAGGAAGPMAGPGADFVAPAGPPVDGGVVVRGGPRMGGAGELFHDSVDAAWPLIRFLLDDPVYRARYRVHLEDVATRVFVPRAIETRLRDDHALIAPYVVGPEGEAAGRTFLRNPEDFRDALSGPSGLLATIARRADEIATTLRERR
jgi:spore coat protein H